MAQAATQAALSGRGIGSIEAPEIPRDYNFATDILDRNLRAGRANKPVFIDRRGAWTYGQLAERVDRFGAVLRAKGVRREERILLCMLDNIDWPTAFLGAIKAGVIPVAVNTLLTEQDYLFMLTDSRARLLVVSQALLPKFEPILSQCPDLQGVIVSGGGGTDTFEGLIEAAQPDNYTAPTTRDDMCFWLYSSGSTGKPKGTVHTQASLRLTDELYAQPTLGLKESDVCYSVAKLFFAYGLGNAMTFPMSVGATTVLLDERPTPDSVTALLKQHPVTVFYGVPTFYAAFLASPTAPQRSEVKFRRCVSAGEALPEDVGRRWTEKYGYDILDGIGSTEMLHIFLSNRPDDLRYGTTGKPVTGYEVELRDEHGQVITGADEVGDLYIKGPSAALMYWGNRDKSRETFQGAWTKSGDKYLRDADGYYIYAGRSDDMLKVSGQYVSPFEVESTLMQHDAVLEAAVIGVDDEQGLTRAKAFVVLKNPQNASDAFADELKAFVKLRLTPHKYPRQIAFVEELPKTATGKIQRFRLRDAERQATAHTA